LKKEKLEQLRKVFKTKIKEIIVLIESPGFFTNEEKKDYISEIADNFVYEVKIRINNKED